MEFLDKIVALDRSVTLAINSAHTPFTDQFWLVFSAVKPWYILYLIVAIAFLWRLGWKKALVFIGAAVVCVVCTDQFANVIKHAVLRPRPCCDTDMLLKGLNCLEPQKTVTYGFFSAHAANSIGFAVISSMAFKQDKKYRNYQTIYTCCIFLWSFLVGMSRIFVGKHYLGDVIVGFACGALFALIIGWGAGKVCTAGRRTIL